MADSSTRLVLLGTGGGPLPSPCRSGISQAVVVGDRVHLVDCGSDVTRQLRRAQLLRRLRSVYLTHLHSDHDCDLFNLFLLGWPILQWNPPVDVFGPGPAGGLEALPAGERGGPPLPLVNPANPTPGLLDVVDHQLRAHAYDLNIRMREAGRADLRSMIVPHEIAVAAGTGAGGPDRVDPPMDPVAVAEDDHVRVTAILVRHPPVFPAFAFRFDSDDGSIVVSGDTAPCPNLVALAQGADVLVHEVISDEAYDGDDDDDQSWEARQRRRHLMVSHTTLSDVGKVAAEAEVGRLVLTHFIPGDDVLPDEHWIAGAQAVFPGEVVVGSDLLELTL